jgi:lipoprotein-releasing system permease protein
MIRPLECFIGLRYLSTGHGRGLISFMSVASLAGITLGVAALIVILSAMNGLETESRNRLLSMAEHITLKPAEGADTDLTDLMNPLRAADGVADVTPFDRIEAVLSNGTNLKPVILRGIDPEAERQDSELAAIVGSGLERLTAGSNRVLLGRFVAADLRVQPGDRINVWLAEAEAGRVNYRPAGFTVAGVFSAGVEEHDSNLALTNLADAGRLIGLDERPEALGIRLDDPMAVAQVQRSLEQIVGPGFRWSNWATENQSLFRAMAIEKTMMTIVLMFIVGVAAFNIVTSLMMVVNEKEKDIAILRTIGLEPGKVTRIFLVQGAAIGIGGTLVGVVLGLLLAANLETILPWLEQTFGFQIMPGDVFYVTEVPSEIHLQDVLLIPGFALVIALLATVFPSRKAARIEPAEVLRYE